MVQVIVGLFLIALGIWSLFDEWYFVVDFIIGIGPILTLLIGLLSLALFYRLKRKSTAAG